MEDIRKVKKVMGEEVGEDDDVECADEEGEHGEEMGEVEDMVLKYGLRESLQLTERDVRNMVRNVPYD